MNMCKDTKDDLQAFNCFRFSTTTNELQNSMFAKRTTQNTECMLIILLVNVA